MKKILITGGTGFIGSHLAEKAVKKGFKVFVFDRYNPNFSLGNLVSSRFKKNIEFIFGDIRDYDSVNKSVKKVDYVFHLAALADIVPSIDEPEKYYKTNVTGTLNVLKLSSQNKLSTSSRDRLHTFDRSSE